LSPYDAVEVAIEVARALAHAHAHGVIHRDIKPSNVFLCDDGSIKLIDFGLVEFDIERHSVLSQLNASQDAEALLDPSPRSAGTSGYMAPEQMLGEAQDARTDLWALGATLFESLSQRQAFASPLQIVRGEPPPPLAELVPALPLELCALVAKLLSHDATHRPPNTDTVVEALEAIRASLDPSADSSSEPYRYLEPFARQDALWFFGRQAEVHRLLAQLRVRPLIAVLGASGAGKSSLVHAGLLPELERRGRWEILSMRPGGRPLERLLRLLQRRSPEHSIPSKEELRQEPGLFGVRVRRMALARSCKVLLLVDQLEELFTHDLPRAEVDAFIAAISSMADDPGADTRVVLAMRLDYLARLAALSSFGRELHRSALLLTRPEEPALRAALVEPASRKGVQVEAELVQAVLEQVSGLLTPLPLLQLTASRLWACRSDARMTLASLQRLGGVAGVLAEHADRAVELIFAHGGERVLRKLLCALVTKEGTRRARSREQLIIEGADSTQAEEILDHLLEHRLLSSFSEGGQTWIELAHESLIEHWSLLRAWVREDPERRRWREELEAAARGWQGRGRPADMLWGGATLSQAQAQRWLPGVAELLDPLALDFLDEGEQLEQRRRWRRQLGIVGTVVLLALSALASFLGMREYQSREAEASLAVERANRAETEAREARRQALDEAERAREEALKAKLAELEASEASREAKSRELAAYADEALAHDPDLALLLGLEAVKMKASFEATDVLQRALLQLAAAEPLVLTPHNGSILELAFSPDGLRFASASADGSIRLWSVNGELLREFRGHRGAVRSVAFSPDGAHILSASADGSARVWELDGTERFVLLGHEHELISARYSPDGETILSASLDGTARLWTARGASLAVLIGHEAELTAASFSVDGQRVLTASADGSLRLWTVSGRELRVIRAHRDRVEHAEFSHDGQHLLSMSLDRTIRVWTAEGEESSVIRSRRLGFRSAHFDPTGQRILASLGDNTVRIWTLDGREMVKLSGHEAEVVSACFSPDGSRVLTASRDGTARLWTAQGRRLAVFRGAPSYLEGAVFSFDERRVLGLGGDYRIRMHHIETQPLLQLAASQTQRELSPEERQRFGLEQAQKGYSLWAAAREPSARQYLSEFASNEEELRGMLEDLGRYYAENGEVERARDLYVSMIEENPNRFERVGYQLELMFVLASLDELEQTTDVIVQTAHAYREARERRLEGYSEELDARYGEQLAQFIRDTARANDRRAAESPAYLTAAASLYELYLDTFPDSPEAYDLAFSYADLLYRMRDLETAALRYWRVFELGEQRERAEDAAFAAVLSLFEASVLPSCPPLPELAEGVEPGTYEALEMPPCRQRLVEAGERYLAAFGAGERSRDLRYTIAKSYYDYNHFDAAIRHFHDNAQRFGDSERGLASAHLLLESLFMSGDFAAMWAVVKDFRGTELDRAPLREKLEEYELGLAKRYCADLREARPWKSSTWLQTWNLSPTWPSCEAK
jgi:WD40 repeat protein